MKKIILCMSLVGVISMMNASESEQKSGKRSVKSLEELRREARPILNDFKKNGDSSYMQLLETKRNKKMSFDHNAGDTKTDHK